MCLFLGAILEAEVCCFCTSRITKQKFNMHIPAVLFDLKTVIRLETVFVVGCVFTQIKLNAKCNICKAKSAFVSIHID